MARTVQVRNMILGEGLPKICVPLTDTDYDHLKQSAQTLQNVPFDFVEWRADFYDEFRNHVSRTNALKMLRDILGDTPILFTIRTKAEGGHADISKEEYEAINLAVIKSGLADLVDVELETGDDIMTRLCAAAHDSLLPEHDPGSATVKIVASKHDFVKTPQESELVKSLCRMQELGADIAKYAVMPNSEQDVLTLLSATLIMKEQHPATPVITMSMGHLGALSRVCGSFFGSCVTFGTAGHASAPGQLPADILKIFLESLA